MKSCNGETAKANMSMKKRTFHCKLIRYFIRLKGAHEGQIIVFDKEPIPQENQHPEVAWERTLMHSYVRIVRAFALHTES